MERQWVRIRSLPIELQSEVHGLAGAIPLRAAPSQRGPVIAALAALGAACLAFGVAYASRSLGGPFDNLARTLPMAIGGALLGGFAAWRMCGVQRPDRGPVLLLGDTVVIAVHDVAVEVVDGETIAVDNLRLVADEPLHASPLDAGDLARASTVIARAASPEARDADPWRQVAIAAGRAEAIGVSRPRLAIGVVAGAALAILLDIGLGPSVPETNPRVWRALAAEAEAVPRVVDRLERDVYFGLDRRIRDATSAIDALDAHAERAGVDMPPTLAAELDHRITELVTSELAATDSLAHALPLLVAVAHADRLPPAATGAARAFFRAHARAALELGAYEQVRDVLSTGWLDDAELVRRVRSAYAAAAAERVAIQPLLEGVDELVAEARGFGVADRDLDTLRRGRLDAARASIEGAADGEALSYNLALWPADGDDELAATVTAAARRRIQALIDAGAAGAELERLRALRERL